MRPHVSAFLKLHKNFQSSLSNTPNIWTHPRPPTTEHSSRQSQNSLPPYLVVPPGCARASSSEGSVSSSSPWLSRAYPTSLSRTTHQHSNVAVSSGPVELSPPNKAVPTPGCTCRSANPVAHPLFRQSRVGRRAWRGKQVCYRMRLLLSRFLAISFILTKAARFRQRLRRRVSAGAGRNGPAQLARAVPFWRDSDKCDTCIIDSRFTLIRAESINTPCDARISVRMSTERPLFV